MDWEGETKKWNNEETKEAVMKIFNLTLDGRKEMSTNTSKPAWERCH
jgi:hypothetical protein